MTDTKAAVWQGVKFGKVFRLAVHLLFWALSFTILLFHFSVSSSILTLDFQYTLLFHLLLWPLVYLNIYVGIPLLLERSKFWQYGLTSAALLLLSLLWHDLLFDLLVVELLPDYYIISFTSYWELLKILLVYWVVSTLLKLSESWFLWMKSREKLAFLQQEKAELELTVLKEQLNPHFLFNSLNAIYSLSLDEEGQVPEALLQLSALMRYILYEAHTEKVALQKEVNFIENYLALQKLRFGNELEISLKVDKSLLGREIAPLLFAPLIENCFKHGIKGGGHPESVDIAINLEGKALLLDMRNSISKKPARHKTAGGIGLLNLQKRLEILYPEQHRLRAEKMGGVFVVELKLENFLGNDEKVA